MTLRLDGRQRAMLAQMGVPVAWLRDSPLPTDEAAPEADTEIAASDAAVQLPPALARDALVLTGKGDPRPDWLVIGDPTTEAEGSGEPFTGHAGRLLDNMLKALGLARGQNVFLAHVSNAADGASAAGASLQSQVQQLQPKIILAMGRFAVRALTHGDEPLGRLRGRAHEYMGIPVVVTYHPAFLLRNLPDKAKAWSDLCFAQAVLARRA